MITIESPEFKASRARAELAIRGDSRIIHDSQIVNHSGLGAVRMDHAWWYIYGKPHEFWARPSKTEKRLTQKSRVKYILRDTSETLRRHFRDASGDAQLSTREAAAGRDF